MRLEGEQDTEEEEEDEGVVVGEVVGIVEHVGGEGGRIHEEEEGLP